MSQVKLSLAIIESLDEKELYQIGKLYMKETEDTSDLIICNGPWDSGIDLTNTSFEYQIQATIEKKNFETKLFSDIQKASNNVENFNLTKKVKYFYSHPLSNTSILKYRRKAKDDYNIILDIIDANRISEVSTEYQELAKLLYDLSNLNNFQSESTYFDDVKIKAFYDLMSFGNATDIKYNIIKSFVLNFLFNNENVQRDTLLDEINSYFGSKVEQSYLVSILNRLSSEHKIKLTKETVYLQEKEKSRIKLVLQNYEIEESLLIRDISEVLKEYNISGKIDQIIKQLSELYENTYSINLSEFTYRDSNINDVKAATSNLKLLIKNIATSPLEDNIVDNLIKKLIKIADSSEILPRIAAGEVYSKVADPERLQRYVHQNLENKVIFLDANVILNLLLAHYEPDAGYDNYFYKIADQFNKFSKTNNFKLKTIARYSMEVASIFKDALAILPFSKLKAFHSLGGSNNVIYKFYQHLSDNDLLEERVKDFGGFLEEFRFTYRPNSDDNFKSQMEYLLSSLEIDIEDHKKYDFNKTAEIIKANLIQKNKSKSNFAVINDAIMFERLGDSSSDVNPVDPIFCSWDMSLIQTRKSYFDQFPGCTRWYMFTPTRLMDHISMMNFQIKPGMVSNEILSILDQDFNFQQMTHTLLDSVATVINANDVVGLKYTNMLSQIRENQILEIEPKVEVGIDSYSSDLLPVDIIFKNLFENYILNKDDQTFFFKKLFTQEVYFDEISSIFTSEKQNIDENGDISNEIYLKIDKLIEIEKNKMPK